MRFTFTPFYSAYFVGISTVSFAYAAGLATTQTGYLGLALARQSAAPAQG